MFLDKPSPLTLKVKSKKAEIFFLKKKDAININHIHHNIVKRLQAKEYKNIESIRRKTIKTLKKYYDINKFKGKNLQDMSWFNEKSKNLSVMDKTNFSINSKLQNTSSNNISIFGRQRKMMLNSFRTNKKKRTKQESSKENTCISKETNGKNIKKRRFSLFRQSQSVLNDKIKKANDKIKMTLVPNRFSLGRLNNIKVDEKLSTKTQSVNNINNNNNYYNSAKDINVTKGNDLTNNSFNIFEKNTNSINYNSISNLYTIKNNSINNNNSISMSVNDICKSRSEGKNNYNQLNSTKEEAEINSIMDKRIRKKIKARIKKEKIINLWKLQSQFINSLLDNEKTNIWNNDELNNLSDKNIIINNNSDVNSFIYNKLLEYLETDDESEEEEPESTLDINKKKVNENSFEISNNISFKIKSSYYNLNNLTKGKIIKNEKYKIDIKMLIKEYLKNRKKKYRKSKSKPCKILKSKYFSTKNFNKEMINDLNSISSISKSNSYQKENKNSENNYSINIENNKSKSSIVTNKIRHNDNHKSDIYLNFNNMEINHNNTKIKIKDNYYLNKIFFPFNKNAASIKNKSKSSSNIIIKDKK
jgi:hypothetical protein